MRLKRIIADNMPHALRIIKSELGDNAVILSTRKIKGPNGEPSLEITAAIDETPGHATPAMPRAFADSLPRVEQGKVQHVAALNSRQAENLLEQHGLHKDVTQRLTKAMSALGDTGFNTQDALEMVLSKMLRFARPAEALPQSTPIVFLGPTGAGKTTTLAKLAVKAKSQKKSVGLITLDTYKIGALEQFDIYADALQEAPQVVRNAEDMERALIATAGRDYVFIDTPGINPFEQSRLEAMYGLLQSGRCHVALVMPANLNLMELNSLPKAFGALQPQSLIFSKLDETAQLGGLVNAALTSNLQVCFATDGQRVPHDLLELDAASLAKRLLTQPRLPWETA